MHCVGRLLDHLSFSGLGEQFSLDIRLRVVTKPENNWSQSYGRSHEMPVNQEAYWSS